MNRTVDSRLTLHSIVPLGASTADRRTPIAKLDASLAHYDSINALEARTHIPKSYMAIAALSIVGASVATGLGVKATTAIFSLAFPTIHLADLAKRGDVESEWKQWMVYFAVASWLNALDHFLGPVLLRVLPSFYLLKVIYLRWLGAVPGYNGGANVYKSLFSQT